MAKSNPLDDQYSWNISRLADGLGYSRDTVRKRLKAARVRPCGKKGNSDLYVLSEAAAAIYMPEAADSVLHDPSQMVPKDRKDWYQSEKERVGLEVNARELLPVEEYRTELANVLKSCVAFFEGLPDRMERRRLFDPAQLIALERETDSQRAQLHKKLTEVSDHA